MVIRPTALPAWVRLSVAVMLAVALATGGCKTAGGVSASDVASSDDPVERTKNSRVNLPEFKMDNELPDVTRRLINNINTCWLQAGLKEVEFSYYRETSKGLPLSAEYLIAVALHDRLLRMVQGSTTRAAELEAGGEMHEVRLLAAKYGLIPESTWPDPNRRTDWTAIGKALNPIAQRLRTKYKALDGRTTLTPLALEKARADVLAEAERELQAFYQQHSIRLPTRLRDANGAWTDPVTFARSFLTDDPNAFAMYVPAQQYRGYSTPTKEILGTVQNSYMTSWENIEATIAHEVDRGASALVSIVWSDRGVQLTPTGIMSIRDRFRGKPLPNDQVGHVVNVVGYHRGANGRVDRVKIENSWGRDSGSHGYYVISWEDFKVIFVGLSVPDGLNYARQQGMRGTQILE